MGGKGVILLFLLFFRAAFEFKPGVRGSRVSRRLMNGDYVLCVMEMKALGVIGERTPMDATRQERRITKDAAKGLRQLRGAVRSLRSGAQLLNAETQT